MAKSYDQINALKEKHKKELAERDSLIASLKAKNDKLEKETKELRRKLYDAGEGKGENNRLKKEINAQRRENKTLQNQISELDGSKIMSIFTPERQLLIKKIKTLKLNMASLNSLALRFQNGLDNVLQVAYLIKNNSAEDIDFYTYVFRDNVVGLLEKMLEAVLCKTEGSASKYLVKLASGAYKFPNDYYLRIPELKNKDTLNNILLLINLQTTGYHGTKAGFKWVKVDEETNEIEKAEKFLNLSNDAQLEAIFVLLKFMYDVFTNKDSETNLMSISTHWFTTL